jgi:hypothetical protein
MATTAAPTTLLSTLAPTTVEDIVITCDPITIIIFPAASRGTSPSASRNTDLDVTLQSDSYELSISIHGELISTSIALDYIPIEISIEGRLAGDILISAGYVPIELSIVGGPTAQPGFENWVAWSRIGYLDFELHEDNEAGRMPLDWRGEVWEIIKLGNLSAVAYGDNGVTILSPKGNAYGKATIHRIGILCKESVVGNEREHFFVDKTSRLYRLTEQGLEMLDYSEYLSMMINPRLTMDSLDRILYISDGFRGYVYGVDSKSFGEGPKNITGFGTVNGTKYVASTGAITIPKFNICTDIYDLGTRKPKTINKIEIGTDLTDDLKAMVESRRSIKDSFIESRWVLVNPSGIAIIPCYGVEFKFHIKSYKREYLEIDYLKIHGHIHEFEGEQIN